MNRVRVWAACLLDGLARWDRLGRIAKCSAYGGKLAYASVSPAPAPSVVACERMWAAESEAEVMERMRSGVAFMEALAKTLEEIRALPERGHS